MVWKDIIEKSLVHQNQNYQQQQQQQKQQQTDTDTDDVNNSRKGTDNHKSNSMNATTVTSTVKSTGIMKSGKAGSENELSVNEKKAAVRDNHHRKDHDPVNVNANINVNNVNVNNSKESNDASVSRESGEEEAREAKGKRSEEDHPKEFQIQNASTATMTNTNSNSNGNSNSSIHDDNNQDNDSDNDNDNDNGHESGPADDEMKPNEKKANASKDITNSLIQDQGQSKRNANTNMTKMIPTPPLPQDPKPKPSNLQTQMHIQGSSATVLGLVNGSGSVPTPIISPDASIENDIHIDTDTDTGTDTDDHSHVDDHLENHENDGDDDHEAQVAKELILAVTKESCSWDEHDRERDREEGLGLGDSQESQDDQQIELESKSGHEYDHQDDNDDASFVSSDFHSKNIMSVTKSNVITNANSHALPSPQSTLKLTTKASEDEDAIEIAVAPSVPKPIAGITVRTEYENEESIAANATKATASQSPQRSGKNAIRIESPGMKKRRKELDKSQRSIRDLEEQLNLAKQKILNGEKLGSHADAGRAGVSADINAGAHIDVDAHVDVDTHIDAEADEEHGQDREGRQTMDCVASVQSEETRSSTITSSDSLVTSNSHNNSNSNNYNSSHHTIINQQTASVPELDIFQQQSSKTLLLGSMTSGLMTSGFQMNDVGPANSNPYQHERGSGGGSGNDRTPRRDLRQQFVAQQRSSQSLDVNQQTLTQTQAQTEIQSVLSTGGISFDDSATTSTLVTTNYSTHHDASCGENKDQNKDNNTITKKNTNTNTNLNMDNNTDSHVNVHTPKAANNANFFSDIRASSKKKPSSSSSSSSKSKSSNDIEIIQAYYEEQLAKQTRNHEAQIDEILEQLNAIETTYTQEIKLLQGRLSKKEIMTEALTNSLTSYQNKNTELKQDYEQCLTKLDEAEGELESARQQHAATLRRMKVEKMNAVEAARDEIRAAAESQFASAQKTFVKLKEDYRVSCKERNLLAQQCEEILQRMEGMEAKERESQGTISKLAAEVADAKAQVATVQADGLKMKQAYNEKFQMYVDREKALNGRLVKAEKERDEVHTLGKEEVREMQILKKENAELQSLCEELMSIVEGRAS